MPGRGGLDPGIGVELNYYWNEFRQRWVMLTSSKPGEIWFAEGDTPVGPWVYARRVVAHDNYNFYNPTQHPFFDQDNGRLIYFEGTYTASFSGAKEKTPRYDYDQIMYRLALDDARLNLPVPLYEYSGTDGRCEYSTDLKDLKRNPICLVWLNPMSVLSLDSGVKPVPIQSR
jgi:hypothetical protein